MADRANFVQIRPTWAYNQGNEYRGRCTKGNAVNLNTSIEGASATIDMDGKLTIATAPDLEAAIAELPESVNEINLDMTNLVYVASAGLRVLVAAEKNMMRRAGTLRLLHPNEEVMEVFEMTGLVDIFTIEQ